MELPEGGHWKFIVNGFSSNGELVALSAPLKLNFEGEHNLPPPYLLGPSRGKPVKNSLTASEDGRILLRWNVVTGAASYDISLTYSKTSKASTWEVKNTKYDLRGLHRGLYFIRLRSKNRAGSAGSYSRSYTVIVPSRQEKFVDKPIVDDPTLMPPNLRKVRVK